MRLDNNRKYTFNMYASGPVCTNDIASGKLDNIQHKLFMMAMDEFCAERNTTFEEFKSKNIIIENKNSDYTTSSTILYKSKSFPFIAEEIDLEEYWAKYIYKNDDLIDAILMWKKDVDSDGNDINVVPNEIVNIDYVRNEATIFNRYMNIKFYVPLNKISNNSKYSYLFDTSNLFVNMTKDILK